MNGLNKMWNMHAIDYYQVIKRNFFFFFGLSGPLLGHMEAPKLGVESEL